MILAWQNIERTCYNCKLCFISGTDPRAELGDGLARLMAHLVLLESLGRKQLGPEQMVVASAKGDLNGVRTCIRSNKDLVGRKALIVSCYHIMHAN